MRGSAAANASAGVVVVHPLDAEDAVITAAMRAQASSTKGVTRRIEARGQFDAFMESVLRRDDVTFEENTLVGAAGLWVHPADWRSDEAILHRHGGGSVLDLPTPSATLSLILQRERQRGRLSRTIGLLPNIPSQLPPTMRWPVAKDLPRGTFTRLLLRGIPPGAI
jgi:hypothetical protein